MIDFLRSIYEYTFLKNAVLAAILASIACGITGSYVVKKKLTFVSGGIAHAVMGGIGIAYFLHINTTIGAIIFAILFSLILTLAKIKAKQNEDSVIGAIWAIGMSIGIIFIYKTPGYNVDLISFIFGNILMVKTSDLLIILLLDGVILFSVITFYYHFLYVSFDEEYLIVRGLKVNFIYFLLLCLISITVVILIKIVGLILIIALLTLPSVITSQFSKNFFKMIIISIILGIIFTFFGIFFSYKFNLPTSACIIILAGLTYMFSLIIKFIIRI